MWQSHGLGRRVRMRGAVIVLMVVAGVAAASHLLPGAEARQAQAAEEGRSVWDGVFTAEQARRGAGLYAQHCAGCHGPTLQGGEYRALTGDRFWTSWQNTSLSALLGYVSTNMPHSEDGSLRGTLGAQAYADITALILERNGFPAGPSEISAAAAAGVRIVRAEGPTELPAGSFVLVVGCLGARDADRNWPLTRGSDPARVVSGQELSASDIPLGDRAYTLRFVITSLERFVGHRVSVRAALMGAGGAEGLNVTSVQSVSETCE